MIRKQEAIDTISKDADTRHVYVRRDGRMCVIAGLAKSAGFPIETFIGGETNTASVNRITEILYHPDQVIDKLTSMAEAIYDHYKLTVEDLISLQHINDSYERSSYRRKALIKFIELMEEDTAGL